MLTPGLFTQPDGHSTLAVEEYSTESGKGLPAPRVFKKFVYPLTFSLDHSGRYLLLGRGRNLKQGHLQILVFDVASGQLTRVSPSLIRDTASRIAW